MKIIISMYILNYLKVIYNNKFFNAIFKNFRNKNKKHEQE